MRDKEIVYEDRIKLHISFDANKLKNELEELNLQNFNYYNVIPLRAPAHTVDTSLPIPPAAEDYADGSWTDWLDTKFLKDSVYLTSIVNFFKEKTEVTLVRLLRLESKSLVKEHTDPTLGIEVSKSVIRLTIPIVSNEKVDFFLNGTTVPMKPGECWYLKLTDPHKVVNNSGTERINLSIDLIPNEWVMSLLKDSQTH